MLKVLRVYLHCVRKNGFTEKDCNAFLEAYLSIRITHPSLTKKIGISYKGAVIHYVQCPFMTRSFRVTV